MFWSIEACSTNQVRWICGDPSQLKEPNETWPFLSRFSVSLAKLMTPSWWFRFFLFLPDFFQDPSGLWKNSPPKNGPFYSISESWDHQKQAHLDGSQRSAAAPTLSSLGYSAWKRKIWGVPWPWEYKQCGTSYWNGWWFRGTPPFFWKPQNVANSGTTVSFCWFLCNPKIEE